MNCFLQLILDLQWEFIMQKETLPHRKVNLLGASLTV